MTFTTRYNEIHIFFTPLQLNHQFVIIFTGDNEPSELDVANRLSVTETNTVTAANGDTVSTSDFVFVSSFTTSPAIPLELTDAKSDGTTPSSGDLINSNHLSNDDDYAKRVLTLDSSAMPSTTSKSALSQVGNVIFQMLGEEGYNSFSCNLTTAGDDDVTSDVDGNTMYRRINKPFKSNQTVNDTLDKIEFQPVDNNSLPVLPESIRDDQEIRFLLLEFNILESCNFTSTDHDNRTERISKKLTQCSYGISKLKMHVNDTVKIILEKYSQDIAKAAKKFKVIQESKMKIIKIINLTDYLSSTIKAVDIPKNLKGQFQELTQFLLVELKNEDLDSFHPDSNRKGVFMVQLFDYLIQSKMVDNKKKKLLGMFKKFIRNVS